MGNPTAIDLKMLYFRKRIKVLKYLVGAAIATTILLIPLIFTSPIIMKRIAISKHSLPGDSIERLTVTGDLIKNKTINTDKLSDGVFGKGIERTENGLGLKISKQFKFDDDKRLYLNNRFDLSESLKNNTVFKTDSLVIGNHQKDPEIGSIITERIIAKSKISSPKIETESIDVRRSPEGSAGSTLGGEISARKIQVGNSETEGILRVQGTAAVESLLVSGSKKPEKGEIIAKAVKANKLVVGDKRLPGNTGKLIVSGDIRAGKIAVVTLEGEESILLDGSKGQMKAESLVLGKVQNSNPGDIITDGNIKTTGGNIETDGNIISLGYIKANTLRLGLSSEVPTNSGEISSNFITVKDSGSERIRLHGHSSKITLEDDGVEKITLDGKTGTIGLKDGKGQKTTISIDNVLEDTTVNDLTIEGRDSFLKIKDGRAGNEDYINLESNGPKLKMVNRQGFSDINAIEINSIYPEIKMSKKESVALISAKESLVKLSRGQSSVLIGVKDDTEKKSFIEMKGKNKSSVNLDTNGLFEVRKDSKKIKVDAEQLSILLEKDNIRKLEIGAQGHNDIRISDLEKNSELSSSGLNFFRKRGNIFSIKAQQNETKIQINSLLKNEKTTLSESLLKLSDGKNSLKASKDSIKIGDKEGGVDLLKSGIHFIDQSTSTKSYVGPKNISIGNIDKKTQITLDVEAKNIMIKSKNGKLQLGGEENGLNIKGIDSSKNFINSKSVIMTSGDREVLIDSKKGITINKMGRKLFSFSHESEELLMSSKHGSASIKASGTISLFDVNRRKSLKAESSGKLTIMGNSSNKIAVITDRVELIDMLKKTVGLFSPEGLSVKSPTGKLKLNSDGIEIVKDGDSFLKADSAKKIISLYGNLKRTKISPGSLSIEDDKNKRKISLGISSQKTPEIDIEFEKGSFFNIGGRVKGISYGNENRSLASFSLNSNEAVTAKFKNLKTSEKVEITPGYISIAGKNENKALPLVLSGNSVRIFSTDVDNTVCKNAGQLVIGTGTCKRGKMLTAIWVGICQERGFLRCPLAL